MSGMALFISMGGVGYAAATIGSAQIKNNSMASKDIKNNSVASKDIKNRAIVSKDISPKTVASLRGKQGEKGDPGPAGSIQGAPAGGDLSGTYPAPTIAAAPPPIDVAPNPASGTNPCSSAGGSQTGVFCGTSSGRWGTGAITGKGVQFWRDRLGEVHIRGDAEIFGGASLGTLPSSGIFVLPPGYRPATFQVYPLSTKGSGAAAASAILYIDPLGSVSFLSAADPDDTSIFLGEVIFRTDA